ncbi:hypothetical protein BKA58DRAFT_404047 [Alternaria rosae]|uniref:uncharacterized protein n=1 Tax=Alternaria rosae TaxID=1187941 RepID=UPI001E8E7C95|nr:uncharacterized protein BKA58DRAFT_404047 [Alternaria rosae]KAH6865461.1 hypothetical protein BKA58DRAFT_404047 [Alternaria rosae]
MNENLLRRRRRRRLYVTQPLWLLTINYIAQTKGHLKSHNAEDSTGHVTTFSARVELARRIISIIGYLSLFWPARWLVSALQYGRPAKESVDRDCFVVRNILKGSALSLSKAATLRERHGRDRSDYVALSIDDLVSVSYEEQEHDCLIEASNNTGNTEPQTSPLEETALVVARFGNHQLVDGKMPYEELANISSGWAEPTAS